MTAFYVAIGAVWVLCMIIAVLALLVRRPGPGKRTEEKGTQDA